MLSDMERDELPAGPAGELAALQADRAALADRARQPWWYDPALGLLVFALLGQASLRSVWWTVATAVLALVGVALLKRAYVRHTGMWVNGLRPGPTRRAIRVWVIGYVLVVGVAAALEYGAGLRGAMVVAGLVLGIAIAAISRWWTTIYQRELRGEPTP